MLKFKRCAAFLLWTIINQFYGLTACEVVVFDCAQGNTVAAKYKNQIMFFDAGRKGYTKFVAFEDGTDEESFQKESYVIRSDNEIIPLRSHTVTIEEKIGTVKSGSFSAERYKKWFAENIKGFMDQSVVKAIFLSHPDEDHYGLVAPCELVPTKAYVLGGTYDDYEIGNFKGFIESKNIPIIKKTNVVNNSAHYNTELDKKEVFFTDGIDGAEKDLNGPEIKILSVNASGDTADRNKDSMVIKLTVNGHHSMVIPGDAESETWDAVVVGEASDPLKTDVLLISHHGSATHGSTSPGLLNRISPKVCLISTGFSGFGGTRHPTLETISLLLNYFNAKSYRTEPHFITCYAGGNSRRSIITDAPIFTTADNGRLSVNLSSANLTLKTARSFWPDPMPVSIEDVDGDEYFLSLQSAPGKSVMTYEALKASNGGNKPRKVSLFEGVCKTGEGDASKYYYRYGTDSFGIPLYYEMEMTVE